MVLSLLTIPCRAIPLHGQLRKVLTLLFISYRQIAASGGLNHKGEPFNAHNIAAGAQNPKLPHSGGASPFTVRVDLKGNHFVAV
jgi:hypothetical protein